MASFSVALITTCPLPATNFITSEIQTSYLYLAILLNLKWMREQSTCWNKMLRLDSQQLIYPSIHQNCPPFLQLPLPLPPYLLTMLCTFQLLIYAQYRATRSPRLVQTVTFKQRHCTTWQRPEKIERLRLGFTKNAVHLQCAGYQINGRIESIWKYETVEWETVEIVLVELNHLLLVT